MSDNASRLDRDRAALEAVEGKGAGAKIGTYLKLSGPGWLQSAITLGGGSLAGGLYLGVLGGYDLMWLQPLSMFLGVAMLSAIAYVTLSTGRRPLRLVIEEVSPVLGWAWVAATIMANVVWCLPQFALGSAALGQNLAPGLFGGEGKIYAVALLAAVALATIVSYERGGAGMKIFEGVLKLLVGVIVLCFVGVVVRLTIAGGIDWGQVGRGFIPNLGVLLGVPPTLKETADATGDAAGFWNELITGSRRDVMLTTIAASVGINMTFLLPNSLLDRGWDKKFRGLATFDLSIGLFVPFLIATACVVMAAAAQFHGKYNADLVAAPPTAEATKAVASGKSASGYLGKLDERLAWEHGADQVAAWKESGEIVAMRSEISEADRKMAAILVQRDADDLAGSLEPLVGPEVAQLVFGVGVLAMALSTIVVLMLINGYALAEITGAPHRGLVHFIGTLIPLLFGTIAPFVWTKAMFYLAVPTSVFGLVLLPIAYVTFLLLMNNRRALGDAMPTGGKRVAINTLLLFALTLATIGASVAIYNKAPVGGSIAAGVLIALALVLRRKDAAT